MAENDAQGVTAPMIQTEDEVSVPQGAVLSPRANHDIVDDVE